MNLEQLWHKARGELVAHNIEDADLEAEVLLRHTLNISRPQLYLELKREVRPEEREKYGKNLERRVRGEPTAYITGHREFFGLDFTIDRRVLIPRMETELLVERAIRIAKERGGKMTVADIGTGSGAIAVSMAISLPDVIIYATDMSAEAIEVAHINCLKHGVENNIVLLTGDLLEPLPEPVDIIVANLPYVKRLDLPRVNTGGFEPQIALDGGEDGLALIRRLLAQLPGKIKRDGTVLLEIGCDQPEEVKCAVANLFSPAKIEIFRDLAGLPRVIAITLRGGSESKAYTRRSEKEGE
jgi:release factor glutamine methyltransferase